MRAHSIPSSTSRRKNSLILARAAFGAFVLAGCVTTPVAQGNDSASVAEAAQAPARGPFVSAANPLAVDAGMKVLARGGSAVDAAVAIQAVLGLVEPQSSGLGGGAFMMFYDADTEAITVYDGRETAPASATPELFYKMESRCPSSMQC